MPKDGVSPFFKQGLELGQRGPPKLKAGMAEKKFPFFLQNVTNPLAFSGKMQ
ncbi:hypothetical protein [uncultured Oscillibacter sp.]|uniref:hypothetical protein n=1 Tax=uncultured Oscillibacter sp. TaxID=876091 RepID=UPI00266F4622|nr:hypothetical protein [uncultured Oscillibacter sp.]